MCLTFPKPQVQPVIDPQATANAAQNAMLVARKGAQGFSQSLLGGVSPMAQNPPLARLMLLGGGGSPS